MVKIDLIFYYFVYWDYFNDQISFDKKKLYYIEWDDETFTPQRLNFYRNCFTYVARKLESTISVNILDALRQHIYIYIYMGKPTKLYKINQN